MDDVKRIDEADKAFDLNQDPEKQWQHSMTSNKVNFIQGWAEREYFKESTLNSIRGERAKRISSGEYWWEIPGFDPWSEKELSLFGQLQHPFIDATCPSHAWKYWPFNGTLDIIGSVLTCNTPYSFEKTKYALWHKSEDEKITNDALERNTGIMLKLFIEASSQYDDLHDLPPVLTDFYNSLPDYNWDKSK